MKAIRLLISAAVIYGVLWIAYRVYTGWTVAYTERLALIGILSVFTTVAWLLGYTLGGAKARKTATFPPMPTPKPPMPEGFTPVQDMVQLQYPSDVKGGYVAAQRPPPDRMDFRDLPVERYEVISKYE